ncbi:MAG: aldo/keto reductase [Oscillospiraceae bacterium]|jgi:predicted aldo/keto reductase-like oxidoreductase|nr:aldo/keto reductase [Oscillospiraceae bacterium]
MPALCFGTLAISPLQRAITPAQGAELLAYAAAKGVTIADTAEYYNTYAPLNLALQTYPNLRVCTKSYAFDTASAARSVRKAQSELARNTLDLFLLHEQENELTLRGHKPALDYYRSLKSTGDISAVGISTHRVAGVKAAIKFQLDAVLAPLNIDGLGLTDGSRSDMENALRDAKNNNMFIMIMKVLGGGHSIARRDESLQYALSLDFVDAIAIGMASKAEIDYNVALFNGESPSPQAASDSASAPRILMIEEGCVGCGNCARRCGQHAIVMRDGLAVALPDRCVRCGYCAAVCPEYCIKIVAG